MTATSPAELSHRDRAVLRAVAAGRCSFAGDVGLSLVVDGLSCCDQFVGARMTRAGLIAAAEFGPGPAHLTPSGQALLQAA
jgi:hypothetical protein